MSKRAAIIALIVAVAVSVYSWWSIGLTAVPKNAVVAFLQQFLDYLFVPGAFVAILLNASLHITSKRILVGANFLFYFVFAYVIARIAEKFRAHSRAEREAQRR